MNQQGQRWLVVAAHDPVDARDGSALRVRQHLETLRHGGAEVKFLSLAPSTKWSELSKIRKILLLPKIFLGLFLGYDPNSSFLFSFAKADRLASTILSFKPTHLLVCESWLVRYVDSLNGGYGFWFYHVLDLHNVEAFLQHGIRQQLMYNAELDLCSFSDEVWVCSKDDQKLVRFLFGANSVVVPNKVNLEYYKDVPRCQDKTIGMVGIWSYGPNGEAAKILLDIWKELLPEWRVVLVGRNPTEAMKEARGLGALITGEVADVRPFLGRIHTVVVPLLQGGGTRMKILEAMAAGVHVIASPKAVEGIQARHLEHLVICEPEEMAGWVRKLWDSPGLAETLRTNARALVKERYSW